MLNEEEKKLIENCKIWVQEEDVNYTRWFGLDELSILVNLIEKQDKMIDLMAQTLLNYGFVLIKSKNGLKEYFRKKVENEK